MVNIPKNKAGKIWTAGFLGLPLPCYLKERFCSARNFYRKSDSFSLASQVF
jgi:hypothetical protein